MNQFLLVCLGIGLAANFVMSFVSQWREEYDRAAFHTSTLVLLFLLMTETGR